MIKLITFILFIMNLNVLAFDESKLCEAFNKNVSISDESKIMLAQRLGSPTLSLMRVLKRDRIKNIAPIKANLEYIKSSMRASDFMKEVPDHLREPLVASIDYWLSILKKDELSRSKKIVNTQVKPAFNCFYQWLISMQMKGDLE